MQPGRLMSLLAPLLCCGLIAADWPQFRGPTTNGVSPERALPVAWDETRSVDWKCPLPITGSSTPAIVGDAIFLTGQTPKEELVVLKIEADTGKIAWTRFVGNVTPRRDADLRAPQAQPPIDQAAPSPVATDKQLVALFGNGLVVSLDHAGKQLWKRNLVDDFGPLSIEGNFASSLVLVDGLAIVTCLQDALADKQKAPIESYQAALDLRDGHVKWRQSRMTGAKGADADSYATPVLAKVDDQLQLITFGGNQLDGRDPATGEQLWSLPAMSGGRTFASPTVSHGHVFFARGNKGPFMAVKLGRTGKLDRRDISWTYDQGTPDHCSPVVWDTLLFTISDDGVARCFDLFTGQLKWKERLPGRYQASPIAAAGRIFFLSTTGRCTVVAASPRFDKLTENQLRDDTLSSPTTSNNRLYLRGRKTLYCLGQGPK